MRACISYEMNKQEEKTELLTWHSSYSLYVAENKIVHVSNVYGVVVMLPNQATKGYLRDLELKFRHFTVIHFAFKNRAITHHKR